MHACRPGSSKYHSFRCRAKLADFDSAMTPGNCMTQMTLGLFLFLGVHLLRELRLRDPLLQRLGEKPYKALYTLLALAGLVLIVWGKSRSEFIMLYEPRYELRSFSHFAMLPAFILFTAGNLPASFIRQATLHPMLLGTAIWGGAHLWANGDLASVVLFGAFTVWALVKFVTLTASVPRHQSKPSVIWDGVAIIGGCILYGLVLVYHGHIFGIGLTFA